MIQPTLGFLFDSYFDHFDGEFKLRVGFQIVQHAIQHRRVDVTVARITRRVARRVPDNVVTRIGDDLRTVKERNCFKIRNSNNYHSGGGRNAV